MAGPWPLILLVRLPDGLLHMARAVEQLPAPPWSSWVVLGAVGSGSVGVGAWGLRKLINVSERISNTETALFGKDGASGLARQVERLGDGQEAQMRVLTQVAEALTGERGIKWSMNRVEQEVARIADIATAHGVQIENLKADVQRNTERLDAERRHG